jgi:leader peptidase (prepilin peptidase) / N-methyltransferase
MTALLISAAAIAGLLAGAYLRGWVFHLSVPTGTPFALHCPGCAARLRTDPRRPGRPLPASGRCPRCRRVIGPRFAALELATAAGLAVLAVLVGPEPELVGYAVLAAVGVALTAIDLAVYRLPNKLVLPTYPVVFGALAVAALVHRQPGRIGAALLGMLLLGGCFQVLRLLRPAKLGGGDVKVAGLMGLPLGWIGLGWAGAAGALAGGALAYVLFACCALGLLYLRQLKWYANLQFGPFLVAGGFAVLLAARVTG